MPEIWRADNVLHSNISLQHLGLSTAYKTFFYHKITSSTIFLASIFDQGFTWPATQLELYSKQPQLTNFQVQSVFIFSKL